MTLTRSHFAARHAELTERAHRAGYTPPGMKYPGFYDAREQTAGIDYQSLLFAPDKTALVMVDMQRIFIESGAAISASASEAIIEPLNELVATARSLDMPIIWTVWAHRSDAINAGVMGPIWGELVPLLPEDPMAQIHPAMDRRDEDLVIVKPKYSTFPGTDFEQILRTLGVDSLILGGIATDVCVEQTLVDAFNRDYACAILSDGTSTTTPFHVETLTHIEKYFGRVLTCAEAADELRALQAPVGEPAGLG